MTVATCLLVLLGLMLLIAVVTDVRARIIPNLLNGAIVLLAPAWWWADGFGGSAILLQLAMALGALVVFGGLFALGMMGGGDVKLIAALALWLPAAQMVTMLFWMALAGGALTLVMVLLHRLARRAGQPEIPYGVAIVAGTFVSMANLILTVSAA